MTTARDVPPALRTGVESILCWAAGRDIPPPDDTECDEEVLLDLVDRHAVTGRLLDRVHHGGLPSWMRPSLYRRLKEQYNDTRALLGAHATAAAEITSRLDGHHEPVVIKGISTYLVTGRPHTIRCGDIDIVCAEGGAAIDVLTGLGYRRTRAPFMHEIGEFTRGSTEIDLHQYFPVYSYAGLLRSNMDPARHSGVWQQSAHRMAMCRIDYPDLARSAIRTDVRGSGRVSVPDPCLLAIILCAHSFMNFTNVWSISHRAKPYVRLAELADLHDLAQHRSFDPGRFQELVTRFAAADAVQWAAWASETLIGTHPWPTVTSRSRQVSFPRCLWWSFWADVPIAPEALVHPSWLDLRKVIPALGGNVIHLTDGTSGQVGVGVGVGEKLHQLPRQLRVSSAEPLPPWTIEIGLAESNVTVTIGLPDRPITRVERVRVDFGRLATEWSSDTSTGRQSAVGQHLDCRTRHDKVGRRLEFRFGDAAFRRAGQIDLLVGITEEDQMGDPVNSVLLPITVPSGRQSMVRTGPE